MKKVNLKMMALTAVVSGMLMASNVWAEGTAESPSNDGQPAASATTAPVQAPTKAKMRADHKKVHADRKKLRRDKEEFGKGSNQVKADKSQLKQDKAQLKSDREQVQSTQPGQGANPSSESAPSAQ